MEKETEKPRQTRVQYGNKPPLILPPGHKVWELNIETGDVKEAKLKRLRPSILKVIKHFLFGRYIGKLDTRPSYFVEEREGFLCVPAANEYKGRVALKNVVKTVGIKVKVK